MRRLPESEPVLRAATLWRDECLLGDGSVFSDKNLWTSENLSHLDRYFVQNLDEGEGNFWLKLESQLAPAPPEAKQLAAEMFWMMYIFVSEEALKPGTKRLQIERIWEWSGEPLPEAECELHDVLERGIGNPGMAYNIYRWKEFLFFIKLVQRWKRLPHDQQRDLIRAPWAFTDWMDAQEESRGRVFRHIVLHLLFPEQFERVGSGRQKRKIAKVFSDKLDEDIEVDYKDRSEIDRVILKIREKLQGEGDDPLDFYDSALRKQWWPEADSDDGDEGPSEDELKEWYQDAIGPYRIWAIGAGHGGRVWPEFERDGIVAIGWDYLGDLSDYDSQDEIYDAMRKYPESGERPKNSALACWEFSHEIVVGDHILVKKGRSQLLAHGVVESDYEFDPERLEYPHIRAVRWLRTRSGFGSRSNS